MCQTEKAYFVNSDNCDKATSSVWYLTITRKICVDCWSETPIPAQMMLFHWMLLGAPKPPFSISLETLKKKSCHDLFVFVYTILHLEKIMLVKINLTIFSSCSALDLIVCNLDLDKIVDHNLFNNITYILLFSCAYLKNVIGWQLACFQLSTYSSDFVSIYFLYSSYIFVSGIPIFLYIWCLKVLDTLLLLYLDNESNCQVIFFFSLQAS